MLYVFLIKVSIVVAGSRPDEVNEFFFNLPNPSGSHLALGLAQHLTEMTNRSRKIMFLGSRVRPVVRADKLTAICEPIV
jgi:hypothetical protein